MGVETWSYIQWYGCAMKHGLRWPLIILSVTLLRAQQQAGCLGPVAGQQKHAGWGDLA